MLASLLLAVASGAFAAAPVPPEAAPRSDTPLQCCFTHPTYYGICVVVPGEDETCEGILSYLNSPNTVGRTYCHSSRVRGGWQQVECPSQTPESSHAGARPSRTCRCVNSTREASQLPK